MDPVIEVRDAVRSYGKGSTLGPYSFSVARGTVLGLVGSNGAGKTTLLRMICGLLRPTSGDIFAYGRRVNPGVPPRHLGAIIEEPPFYSWAAAATTLELAAAGDSRRLQRVESCLRLVGLDKTGDLPIRAFSQGMRQRLGIARALLGEPQILVLDEPTNGLDPQGIRWLRTLLRDLAADGAAVIVASHLLSELRNTADRILVFRSGTQVAELGSEELAAAPLSLEERYFAVLD